MATEPAARPTPVLHRDQQAAMYQRALKTLPGGTDSNFRAWGESTIYVDRGQGGEVWDIDGNAYLDLLAGIYSVNAGYGRQRIVDAMAAQATALPFVNPFGYISVPAAADSAGVAELIIGKQRNGPTGVVKLAFIREFTRFENLAAGA